MDRVFLNFPWPITQSVLVANDSLSGTVHGAQRLRGSGARCTLGGKEVAGGTFVT